MTPVYVWVGRRRRERLVLDDTCSVYVWVGRRRERLVLDDTCSVYVWVGRRRRERLVLDDTCLCLGRKKKKGKVSIR